MMNEKVKGPMLTLSDLYNDDVYIHPGLIYSNPWLKPNINQTF